VPLDMRRRIFQKVSKDNWRDRMTIMTQASGDEDYGRAANHTSLAGAAFEASASAQIVVDSSGLLAMFNERARMLFNVVPSDLRRPIQDLELYKPIEPRVAIEQAVKHRRPVTLNAIEAPCAGRETRYFDVQITPLVDGAGRSIGASIAFSDVSRAQELQAELSRAKQDLETAYEELQSTNEELETTNEELQSTVEELETTNEELQSTNEELETMNEELQSTNEELQTINEELRQRSDDLNRANSLLESILTGIRSGVVVVDRELRVLAWNHRAEDLWGLRGEEVQGQNLFNLDIGLPTEQLRVGIRSAIAGDGHVSEAVVPATNRRGKKIECKITVTPLLGPNREGRGAILLMEEQSTDEGALNARGTPLAPRNHS
jgi:two-component system CheB/CheR fusion protein